MKGFFNGVKQLIYWFPIIWKNRWWDYEYLLILMKHQLTYMLKHWEKDTHHLDDKIVKKEIEEMRNCILLFQVADLSQEDEIKMMKAVGDNFDRILSWWD